MADVSLRRASAVCCHTENAASVPMMPAVEGSVETSSASAGIASICRSDSASVAWSSAG